MKGKKEKIKRHVGRPTVDRSDKLRQSFEMTKPLRERLEKEAEGKNITISALIRDILEKHYENREF